MPSQSPPSLLTVPIKGDGVGGGGGGGGRGNFQGTSPAETSCRWPQIVLYCAALVLCCVVLFVALCCAVLCLVLSSRAVSYCRVALFYSPIYPQFEV